MERALAWVDALLALIMVAATLYLIHERHVALQAADRTGLYTDVGVGEILFIVLYTGPNLLLCALAALCMWLRAPGRWVFQVLSSLGVCWYPALLIAYTLRGS